MLLDEQDVIALDLLGYGYYLIGDPVSALRFLDAALAIDPGYPPIYLHVALVQIRVGNIDLALENLQKTLELAPDSSEAEQATRILDTLLSGD